MLCSSVQLERPSCAISGGQSFGRAGGRAFLLVFLPMAKSADMSLHVRHLSGCVSFLLAAFIE